MNILAFDTAAARCAVAVLCFGPGAGQVTARTEPMTRGQAERLMPLIDSVLAEAGLALTAIDRIAVGTGPGNFTGTRIGVAAARGLALALDIPAVGVTSLEALAGDVAVLHAPPHPQGVARSDPVLALVDARHGRVYAQGFGGLDLPARRFEPGTLADLDLPRTTRVVGFAAAEMATLLGLCAPPGQGSRPTPDHDPDPSPQAFARIAALREAPFAPPAPLYLRGPDAALPADLPPIILDAAS